MMAAVTQLVRVWIVPIDVSPDTAASCWDVLDTTERARARALLNPRDRQQFTVAHGALRILAGCELNAPPSTLTWISGPQGKPELAPRWSGLHTSLSHSADLVAAAVSIDRPVGVDIQHLVPGLDTVGLAVRFFPPDEGGYVAAGGDPRARADRFAHLWARKEAVVKAAGGRLWANLRIAVRGRDVVRCTEPASAHRVADIAIPADIAAADNAIPTDIAAAAGYRAAVALAGAAPFVVEAVSWPSQATAPAAVS